MFSFLVLLSFLALTALAAPQEDRIVNLPGMPNASFAQYSGYVDVAPERSLFYWFAEHVTSPATAPLVVWLQGGPGCSSLIGLFTENGPWVINAEGDGLTANAHSWNRQANVLFIESPAAVGYSYDTSAPVPTSGDNQTMTDLHTFLLGWMKKFPEFHSSDLYISGESFGGHYVPQLSWTILEENSKGNGNLNLKGMLVGNPWTDDYYDGGSTMEWIYMHALCSKNAYDAVVRECGDLKFSKRSHGRLDSLNFIMSHEPVDQARNTQGCNNAMQNVMKEVGPDIDQYDVYSTCFHKGGPLGCNYYGNVHKYLNTYQVMRALHVRMNKVVLPWTVCSDHLNYASQWDTVVPLYKVLIPALEHVMVYSGDVTFNCDGLGSVRWIHSLGMETVQPYHTYKNPANDQVAGFHQGFAMTPAARAAGKRQFSFATVRDAGHMVPQYQPERAFIMLEHYLANRF